LIQVNADAPRASPDGEKISDVSDLHQKPYCAFADYRAMWQPVASAPFDCDLELAVIDAGDPHALVFPCRRILGGWMNADTKERLDVRPTHWRRWDAARSGAEAVAR